MRRGDEVLALTGLALSQEVGEVFGSKILSWSISDLLSHRRGRDAMHIHVVAGLCGITARDRHADLKTSAQSHRC